MSGHVQESKHGASHSTEEENSEDHWNNVHRKASLEKIKMLKTVKASPKLEKSQLPHCALSASGRPCSCRAENRHDHTKRESKISSRVDVGGQVDLVVKVYCSCRVNFTTVPCALESDALECRPKSQKLPLPQQSALVTPQRLHRRAGGGRSLKASPYCSRYLPQHHWY